MYKTLIQLVVMVVAVGVFASCTKHGSRNAVRVGIMNADPILEATKRCLKVGRSRMRQSSSRSTFLPNVSCWGPQRPPIVFNEGDKGESYPTFNNQTKNTNISHGGRQGDERQFLVVKHCPGGK